LTKLREYAVLKEAVCNYESPFGGGIWGNAGLSLLGSVISPAVAGVFSEAFYIELLGYCFVYYYWRP
jgi:hypothetical protein